ncbi:MAG TPA: cytochrome c [Stellaceae bacterium]|nr:cytochrome c [Stellaceae bacterium]
MLVALTSCSLAPPAPRPGAPAAPDPAAAKRGEYLAAAANCAGCHTDKEHGGAPFAGGKAIATSFGAYYSRNITPDPQHGIGAWSEADFHRALRDGIAPGGGHYFPAFPFPSFTFMTDGDIADIFAYLETQRPAPREDLANDVPFPYDVRLSMVLWRALYFKKGPLAPDPRQSAEWNRGAYLVTAVAHCADCHSPRTSLGAVDAERRFNGGTLYGPGEKHAPNITPDMTDGIGKWRVQDIATLLKTGITASGDVVSAPMSEVVEGTAKLSDADRMAIAAYLKSLKPLPGKGG